MKILIVEDDKIISFGLKSFLLKEGYEVKTVDKIELALKEEFLEYDLVILDESLPDGSGFSLLKDIKNYADIPVLMLTVKDQEEYILKGFELGCSDYITKPFSVAILKARIENIFRKYKKTGQISYRDLVLDVDHKSATLRGKDLLLNEIEIEILKLFLLNRGRNLTRDRLLEVWEDEEIEDNTLTVTIKRLKEKLLDYRDMIKTIRGIGYAFKE